MAAQGILIVGPQENIQENIISDQRSQRNSPDRKCVQDRLTRHLQSDRRTF